jgi:hypothetical protein
MPNVKTKMDYRRKQPFYHKLLVGYFAMGWLVTGGCSTGQSPQAKITWIDSVDLTPKSADCSIPILSSEPFSKTYRTVAIVEAWGKANQKTEVLDTVRQGACKIGADALLITSSQSQLDARFEKMGLPSNSEPEDGATSSQVSSYKERLMPKIGEQGHPGYYVDTFAIVYMNGARIRPSP